MPNPKYCSSKTNKMYDDLKEMISETSLQDVLCILSDICKDYATDYQKVHNPLSYNMWHQRVVKINEIAEKV